MRIIYLIIPHFSALVELLRRPYLANTALLVTRKINGKAVIHDFINGASELEKDMLLSKAELLLDKHEAIEADFIYYRAISNQIFNVLQKVTPCVEKAELGQFYLDLKGKQESSEEIAEGIIEDLRPMHFMPQIGIGDSKFFARIAADIAKSGSYNTILSTDNSKLKYVSVDNLPVSQSTQEKLKAFGIWTLDEISLLKLNALQEQFGKEGCLIWNLLQGRNTQQVTTQKPVQVFRKSAYFFVPLWSKESLFHVVRKLVSKILDSAPIYGRYISVATIEGRTSLGYHCEKHIVFKEPVGDCTQIALRLASSLEETCLMGGLEEITVALQGFTSGQGRQMALFDDVRTRDNLNHIIALMEMKWGRQLLYKVQPINVHSRIPERRYSLE